MPLPFSRRASQTAPSFSRDFAGLKTLDHGVGPAITFTRASNATFFDANGTLQTASNDTPRFDHSGGSSLGLLIEEARTNLLERSAEFDDAYWAKAGGTVTANTTVAPDGTTSADTFTGNAGDGYLMRTLFGLTSGQTVTLSCFLRVLSGSLTVPLVISSDAFSPISVTNASATTAWQRVSVSAVVPADGIVRCIIAGFAAVPNGVSIQVWGAQLEAGAFPTSYIPTTSAAATRAADFAKIDGISSFFNAAEGSVYTEHTQLVAKTSGSVNKFPWVMNFGANAASPILGVYAQNQSTDTFLNQAIRIDSAGSVTQAEQGATLALTAGTIHKFIAGYATNNVATYRNGSAGGTDGTVDLSGITGMERMGIGTLYRDTIGNDYLNGHIRKIAYWPRRLSNTLLQQLTT
jgi:hypothetical protein